jgi:AraC-like DNA-binding protein
MDRLLDHESDAISQLLGDLRVRSTLYCRSELRAPWGLAVKPAEVPVFHMVSHGHCWLEVAGLAEAIPLEAGDVVLLLTGSEHRLYDDPASGVEWLEDILHRIPAESGRLGYGGRGDVTELICGWFELEGAPAHPLLASLPPVLRLGGGQPGGREWIQGLLAVLEIESSQDLPGGETMLARIADVVVAQAIRTFLVELAERDRPGFGALLDARIATAVRLFHADPAHPWTIGEMAKEVAMSRSSFASRFRQLTGEPPIRYLTRCRLARAASLLASGNTTIFAVARQVGYESESSLAKAFGRAFGESPGSYRRRTRTVEGTDPVGLVASAGAYPLASAVRWSFRPTP